LQERCGDEDVEGAAAVLLEKE
jgi:hypothetical protein